MIDIIEPVSRGSTRPVGAHPLVAAQQRTEQLFSAPDIRQTDLGSGALGITRNNPEFSPIPNGGTRPETQPKNLSGWVTHSHFGTSQLLSAQKPYSDSGWGE